MDEERLKAILESLLFAASGPVALAQLVSVLDTIPRDSIRLALADLASAYSASGRGIVLEEVANGYQLRTPKEHAFYVRKLLAAKPPRLSRPLLETLAIIAYRQPVTRPEIEQLRGVDCGGVIDTLLGRRLIQIGGRKDAPGRPIMYATTAEFLEVFSLKDLANLPDLEEFRAIEDQRGGDPSPEASDGDAALPADDLELQDPETTPPSAEAAIGEAASNNTAGPAHCADPPSADPSSPDAPAEQGETAAADRESNKE
ncbi:MAG: SMC-Scp complex subunit ScpB [Candidatus Binataceae bacterium]